MLKLIAFHLVNVAYSRKKYCFDSDAQVKPMRAYQNGFADKARMIELYYFAAYSYHTVFPYVVLRLAANVLYKP